MIKNAFINKNRLIIALAHAYLLISLHKIDRWTIIRSLKNHNFIKANSYVTFTSDETLAIECYVSCYYAFWTVLVNAIAFAINKCQDLGLRKTIRNNFGDLIKNGQELCAYVVCSSTSVAQIKHRIERDFYYLKWKIMCNFEEKFDRHKMREFGIVWTARKKEGKSKVKRKGQGKEDMQYITIDLEYQPVSIAVIFLASNCKT